MIVTSGLHKNQPGSAPRVLVSVLNYNSVQDTIATLRCLQPQTYPHYHLQLVDSASTNNCVEQIAQVFPDLEIKILPENLGYSGGNNYVLKQSLTEGYDYVIICNQDIEVDEHAIANLVETAEMHHKAGVIGGIEECFFTEQKRAAGGFGYSLWTSRPRWLSETPGDSGPRSKVEYVQGSLVLFTARALKSGIFMDDNLFMYFEEADIGFQLKAKGLEAYVDQRVIVRHKNKPKWYNVYGGYLQQRNRLYMVKKYGAWYHKLFYMLYVLLFELPVKVSIRSLQGHIRFARSCVLGHIDGVRDHMGPGRLAKL